MTDEEKKHIIDFLKSIINSQEDRIILVWEAEQILNLIQKQQEKICDKCNKEIDYEDWYYSADITSQSNACSIREQIIKGDHCNRCFKEIINKKINIKEDKE